MRYKRNIGCVECKIGYKPMADGSCSNTAGDINNCSRFSLNGTNCLACAQDYYLDTADG